MSVITNTNSLSSFGLQPWSERKFSWLVPSLLVASTMGGNGTGVAVGSVDLNSAINTKSYRQNGESSFVSNAYSSNPSPESVSRTDVSIQDFVRLAVEIVDRQVHIDSDLDARIAARWNELLD